VANRAAPGAAQACTRHLNVLRLTIGPVSRIKHGSEKREGVCQVDLEGTQITASTCADLTPCCAGTDHDTTINALNARVGLVKGLCWRVAHDYPIAVCKPDPGTGCFQYHDYPLLQLSKTEGEAATAACFKSKQGPPLLVGTLPDAQDYQILLMYWIQQSRRTVKQHSDANSLELVSLRQLQYWSLAQLTM
jgi:hypothetical protein